MLMGDSSGFSGTCMPLGKNAQNQKKKQLYSKGY